MDTEEVQVWVKQAKEEGIDDDTVRDYMKLKGYPDAFVEKTLMDIQVPRKRNPLFWISLAVAGIIILFSLITYLLYAITSR